MITSTIAADPRLLTLIAMALFLFGCAYAVLVYGLGERKVGYVAMFVVVGVGVTLGAEAVIDARAALLSLICFSASGIPMIAGEIIQHMHARDRAINEYRTQAATDLERPWDEQ